MNLESSSFIIATHFSHAQIDASIAIIEKKAIANKPPLFLLHISAHIRNFVCKLGHVYFQAAALIKLNICFRIFAGGHENNRRVLFFY